MQPQEDVASVQLPFRSILDFEVRRNSLSIPNPQENQDFSENKIVFAYKKDSSQGEKIVVTFVGGAEGQLSIHNEGDSLFLTSKSGSKITILSHA